MDEYAEKRKQILLAIKSKVEKTKFKDVDWPNEENIRNWTWVGDESGLIGNDNCHYEFIFQEDCPKKLSLEVHLCEAGKHELFKNIILPNKLKFDKWYRWYKGNKNELKENGRIVFRTKRIDINDSEIVHNCLALLEELHNAIGEQLLEIMQSHPELLPKQFQLPKLLENSRKIVTEKEYAARTYEEAKTFDSMHGEIQEKLKEILEQKRNYRRIIKESGFKNYKYQIDLLAQKENNRYDIFEVKPYPTAMACMREALGQLLFYKFLLEKGGYEVDTLYIVGPSELSDFEDEFLQSIKNDLKKSKIKYYPVSLD
ncbi:MAG: hypothetical protein J6X11_13470 [Treponema sp.]|nr:hypothetical protein [Treponema sp.]